MSGVYPVTSQVTPIFPSAQPDAQTVKNTGLAAVYVGNSSAVSIGNGYALGPGSAITWEAGNPLFAVCATGTSSTLTVLDNGGPLFDASAVAAQIKVSGVPIIDAPVVLWDDTQTNSNHLSPNIDISKYQSISIFIFEKQTSGSDPAQPGINSNLIREVLVDMFSSTLGSSAPPFREYVGEYAGGGSQGLTGDNPQFTAVLPALGDTMTVTVNGTDVGISGSLTSRIVVFGSYRSVQKAQFRTNNTYQTHDGFLSGYADAGTLRWETGSLAANQGITSIPPTLSGKGQIAVYVGSSVPAPGLTIFVQDIGSGAVLAAYFGTSPSPDFALFDVNIPASPLLLSVKNLSASAAINATIIVSFLYDLG